MRLLLSLFACLYVGIMLTPHAVADTPSSAVVIAYFTVDEDTGAGGVTPDQFAAHLESLAESGATILPLDTIIRALETGGKLPPKAVAITFESASRSNARYAWPLLTARKWPFTVFVSASQMQQPGNYVSADTLRGMAHTAGITIGVMPSQYDPTIHDTSAFWRSLNSSRATVREITGQSPTLFAYPQGIPPRGFSGNIQKQGFKAGFGQQSGVVSRYTERWLLPRYTMAQGVAGDDRIPMILRALPLPAFAASPPSGLVDSNPPPIGFTLHKNLVKRAKTLNCTASDGQIGSVSLLGRDRIEVRFPHATTKARLRVNCIMPDGTDENGDDIYRWLGFLYEVSPLPDEPQ